MLQVFFHLVAWQIHSKEVHHLCDSSLGSNIVTADNPSLSEGVTRVIKIAINRAIAALRDIENHHSPIDGIDNGLREHTLLGLLPAP